MKEVLLALMVLAGSDGETFQQQLEENLSRCEELKLDVCTFTIDEDPVPTPVIFREQCETVDGERVCMA